MFKSSKNQNLKFLNSKFLYIIQRKYVIQRDSFNVSGPKVTHANIVSHVDHRLDGLVVLGHQRRMQLDRGRVRGVVVLVRHRLRRQALDVETVGGLQQGRQLRVVNTHLAAVHKLQQRLQVVGVHAGQHDDRMFARGVLRGGRGEKETERKQRNLVSDEKKKRKKDEHHYRFDQKHSARASDREHYSLPTLFTEEQPSCEVPPNLPLYSTHSSTLCSVLLLINKRDSHSSWKSRWWSDSETFNKASKRTQSARNQR